MSEATEAVDGELVPRTPSPPAKWRPMALNNARAVRREMTRVYNDARSGKLDVQQAARLTYILGEVRRTIEVMDIERRLAALETGLGN